MNPLVAVDPGLDACGAAWFSSDGVLRGATLLKRLDGPPTGAERWRMMAESVDLGLISVGITPKDFDLAIELPQAYARSRSKGDPNDLIELAAVVGAIVAECAWLGVHAVRPAEWKGQVPKDVMVRRIRTWLDDEEASRVALPGRSLAHNVWDAVGIGVHRLRMLGARR